MLNLFQTQSAPTWDDPIEMLYACHGKVQKFCSQLNRLPEYLATHGCHDAEKQAIMQICTYFNRAAPLHHEDEEQDFFPALVKYCPETQVVIENLETQHIDLHENWVNLHEQLQATLNGERIAPDVAQIHKFTQAYDVHIPVEEQLFELGKQHIPHDVLREMGKVMAARRRT